MESKKKLVIKNISLPVWVVKEWNEMAAKQKNKFKPYVEWTLISAAENYRDAKKAEKDGKK